jgi:glycosyltransferase involved in cell wall biosynthesis
VRLLFLGLKHPNPEIPEMRMAVAARALADELELTGRNVFFNEGWVPYDERHNYLLEADVGVTVHQHHIETEFSFRTRVLDYFWARLPVVSTNGDAMAEIIDANALGITVPPGDELALEQALFRLLTDRELAATCRRNIDGFVDELHWSKVLEPLLAFCRAPRRAPDLVDPLVLAATGIRVGVPRRSGVRHDLALFMTYLAEGGPRLLARRIWSRSKRVLGGR